MNHEIQASSFPGNHAWQNTIYKISQWHCQVKLTNSSVVWGFLYDGTKCKQDVRVWFRNCFTNSSKHVFLCIELRVCCCYSVVKKLYSEKLREEFKRFFFFFLSESGQEEGRRNRGKWGEVRHNTGEEKCRSDCTLVEVAQASWAPCQSVLC